VVTKVTEGFIAVIFGLEDGGGTFLRNIGNHVGDCVVTVQKTTVDNDKRNYSVRNIFDSPFLYRFSCSHLSLQAWFRFQIVLIDFLHSVNSDVLWPWRNNSVWTEPSPCICFLFWLCLERGFYRNYFTWNSRQSLPRLALTVSFDLSLAVRTLMRESTAEVHRNIRNENLNPL
jgi:hypothetical protein